MTETSSPLTRLPGDVFRGLDGNDYGLTEVCADGKTLYWEIVGDDDNSDDKVLGITYEYSDEAILAALAKGLAA